MRIDELFSHTVPGQTVWKKRGARLEKVVVPATAYSITPRETIEVRDDA